jgi:hypothetical protein
MNKKTKRVAKKHRKSVKRLKARKKESLAKARNK